MAETVRPDLEALSSRLSEVEGYLHIDERRGEVADLEARSAAPGFWDNADSARDLMARLAAVRGDVERIDAAHGKLEDARAALELADETGDEDLLAEASGIAGALEEDLSELELSSWFTDELDHGDAIVTVTPGQGGLEAQDWCEMLFRMYQRYCDRRGWGVTVNDAEPGEAIGLNRATFTVSGHNAYGMLRAEQGVHRLVRISPTDAKKRRQTTFAGVEVLPVLPDDIEVDLNPADVRVDVYRSSGPGGQCVNTTDSAVRLTHLPTGIVVTCQNEKSQLQNKEAAFKVLRAKLYEIEQRKREQEINELRGERMENSFGSQIRNYVLYPYQMVKDVRSGVETSNVDAVLDGDIDEFVLGYHKWRVSQ